MSAKIQLDMTWEELEAILLTFCNGYVNASRILEKLKEKEYDHLQDRDD